MDRINEAHVSEPGLVVVDVAAADDATALAFQQLLADRWATSLARHTTRDAGELLPGPAPAPQPSRVGRGTLAGRHRRPTMTAARRSCRPRACHPTVRVLFVVKNRPHDECGDSSRGRRLSCRYCRRACV
ncbi:DUF6207 family protein [Streptomyces sp. NPDC090088]|uniref:DUF6207 family protein n=1 Tax=Streptomyces sp. NPDC090088 TaxID=3365944 RepID=UPI00382801F7